MANERHNPELSKDAPINCADFELLLTEAVEGALPASAQKSFETHRDSCSTCAFLYAEAATGAALLRSLPELEPPPQLLQRILLATSDAPGAAYAAASEVRSGWAALGWREKLRLMPTRVVTSVWRPILQPRFAMSFAMAFFSISSLLNLAGMRKLNVAALRPSAVRDTVLRTYNDTQARVVRYYENLRFIYELESRMRELRNAAEPPEPKPQENTNPQQQPQQNEDNNDPNRVRNEGIGDYPQDAMNYGPDPSTYTSGGQSSAGRMNGREAKEENKTELASHPPIRTVDFEPAAPQVTRSHS